MGHMKIAHDCTHYGPPARLGNSKLQAAYKDTILEILESLLEKVEGKMRGKEGTGLPGALESCPAGVL